MHMLRGRRRKGVMPVIENIIISFFISFAAGVACHYLCKWLDER